MSSYRTEALELMLRQPAQVGRWCGFTRLSDGLHNDWMRQMIGGTGDLYMHRKDR